MVYFLRYIARIQSQDALPDLLFGDARLMQRIRFKVNTQQTPR